VEDFEVALRVLTAEGEPALIVAELQGLIPILDHAELPVRRVTADHECRRSAVGADGVVPIVVDERQFAVRPIGTDAQVRGAPVEGEDLVARIVLDDQVSVVAREAYPLSTVGSG